MDDHISHVAMPIPPQSVDGDVRYFEEQQIFRYDAPVSSKAGDTRDAINTLASKFYEWTQHNSVRPGTISSYLHRFRQGWIVANYTHSFGQGNRAKSKVYALLVTANGETHIMIMTGPGGYRAASGIDLANFDLAEMQATIASIARRSGISWPYS
jgi:hypothetical protein